MSARVRLRRSTVITRDKRKLAAYRRAQGKRITPASDASAGSGDDPVSFHRGVNRGQRQWLR